MTGGWACFGLWGPRARELLAPLTPQSLAAADFPFLSMRETTVGDVPVRALRVTFVGELGWELHCSTEYGAALWATLAGTGARPGGYRAIESLRLEKGYRVWGADIGPDTTPDEAGLALRGAARARLRRGGGAACGPGAGRDPGAALPGPRRPAGGRAGRRAGPAGADAGTLDVGAIVGAVTSGGYGYTVARSIAYAYLPERGRGGRPGSGAGGRHRGSRARSRALRCTTRPAPASGRDRRRPAVRTASQIWSA